MHTWCQQAANCSSPTMSIYPFPQPCTCVRSAWTQHQWMDLQFTERAGETRTHLDVVHHELLLCIQERTVWTLENRHLLVFDVLVKVAIQQSLQGKYRVAHGTLIYYSKTEEYMETSVSPQLPSQRNCCSLRVARAFRRRQQWEHTNTMKRNKLWEATGITQVQVGLNVLGKDTFNHVGFEV